MTEPRIRSLAGRLAVVFLIFLFTANLFFLAYIVAVGLPEIDPENPQALVEAVDAILADSRTVGAVLSLQAVAGILTVLFMAVVVDRRPLTGLGFGRSGMGAVFWGMTLGAVLASVVALLISALGARHLRLDLFSGMTPQWVTFLVLGVAAAAFMEEWLFRGYLYVNIRERYPASRTILVTAFGFAVVHATNPGVSALGWINIVLVGIVLGQLREVTGGLEVPFGLHLGWNLALGMVFGVPVSGFDMPSVFRVSVEDLPGALGGGEFGPEASGVLTMTFGVIAVVLARRLMPPDDEDMDAV